MTFMELKLLHAFNAWASNRIFDAVWLSQWLGTPDCSFLSIGEVPTLADVRAAWERVGFETARSSR